MTIKIKTGMKILHLHARSKAIVDITEEEWSKVPKPVGLLASIQHLHTLRELHEKHKNDSVLGGQVLGCRCEAAERINSKVKSYLVIATGYFHSQRVAMNTNKPVFVYDPIQKNLTKQPREQIERILKKRRTALTKFYAGKNIGILVSIKHGQCDINKALAFIKEIDKEKKAHIFAFDTLEIERLKDYNFIDCWVNTACNRIPDEKTNIIDIGDIPEFEKYSESWLKNGKMKRV
ncbi:diphthamide synthesis protein [Candidatus Woesearchaeota archaeon]|nr:diphthamide synthesis protein [Candidatus Woesearchaeota archaeon]